MLEKIRRRQREAMAGVIAALLIGAAAARGAEITATVREATAEMAKAAIDGNVAPIAGDRVEIYFTLPGSDDEISVATGSVTKVEGSLAQLKIEHATGEVAKDHKVRIKSGKPAPIPPALSPAPEALVQQRPEGNGEPPHVGQMASQLVSFDHLATGALESSVFSSSGIVFEPEKGKPEVYPAQPNMILPPPCRQIMMVNGGPVTALRIRLDPPVKRFALYRIGTARGASTPTWQMSAYDAAGKLLGQTGEEHGLPPFARYFGIDAAGIVRVELTTDNRHGKGTWATWNSLPIAGFGFDR